MVPEGEIILTINVYYPAVFDKVRVTFFVCLFLLAKLLKKKKAPQSCVLLLNIIFNGAFPAV